MLHRFAWMAIVMAAAAAAGGCATTTGAVPKPFPMPGAAPAGTAPVAPAPATATPPSTATLGYSIAGTALSLRGTPYRDGGNDPSGFDCSGFVRYVFAQNGLGVPRTVAQQAKSGRRVPEDQLQPGDLVFFSTVAPGPSHVGIAIGGDEFVHAPSERGEVRVERLSTRYWATRFLEARRVS